MDVNVVKHFIDSLEDGREEARRLKWDEFMESIINIKFEHDPIYDLDKIDSYSNLSFKEELVYNKLMLQNGLNIESQAFKQRMPKKAPSFVINRKKPCLQYKFKKAKTVCGALLNEQLLDTICAKHDILTEKIRKKDENGPLNMLNMQKDDVISYEKENLPNSERIYETGQKHAKKRNKILTSQQQNVINKETILNGDKSGFKICEKNLCTFFDDFDDSSGNNSWLLDLISFIEEDQKSQIKDYVLQKRWLELKGIKDSEKYSIISQCYSNEFCRLQQYIYDADIVSYVRFVLFTYSKNMAKKFKNCSQNKIF